MTETELPSDPTRAVAVIWISLARAGVPLETWLPIRIWRVAVRTLTHVQSHVALRYWRETAEDLGLLTYEPGAGGRKGRFQLRTPDHPEVVLPPPVHEVAQRLWIEDPDEEAEGQARTADPAVGAS